jgi:SagB-type dehydrogenase family enzyme
MPLWDAQSDIGNRYHQQTKYPRPSGYESQLVKADATLQLKREGLPAPVPLPPPRLKRGPSIWETVRRRRSIRRYLSRSLDQAQLSLLLWAAQGVTSQTSYIPFRTSPSAGASYPIESYVVIQRVEQFPPGIYRYLPQDHALQPIALGSVIPHLAAACMDQSAVAEAALVLVWTAVIRRCTAKYQQRGYRYIYMETGHICQNLYLAATALDLGCCAIGAFFDDEVNRLLGVDGVSEAVIYLAGVGGI